MGEGKNIAEALVEMAYILAALAAVGAATFWFRVYDARRKTQSAGKPPTFEWFSEAANATGIALGLGGLAFLVSRFV